MKKGLPPQGKIAKEAKETIQDCVTEFICFITSEVFFFCFCFVFLFFVFCFVFVFVFVFVLFFFLFNFFPPPSSLFFLRQETVV